MTQQPYSDSTKQTLKNYRVNLSSQIYKGLSGKQSKAVELYGYDDISLKLFLEIASTGAFERLVKKGKSSLEGCLEQWEKIIVRNSEENASFQYQSYMSLLEGYSLLLAQHTTVKLLLLKASIQVDQSVIQELNERGFKINVSPTESQWKEIEAIQDKDVRFLVERKYRSLAYATSLENATRKSNVLVTKINMKHSELEKQRTDKKGGEESFVDVIAGLEVALGDGRNIPDDITLAKYNALKKLAKKKSQAMSKLGKK